MELTIIIDRIENNGLAVLEIEGVGGDFLWPVEFLPPDAHEGSVLRFSIDSDPDEEDRRRKKMRDLQRELLERSGRNSPAED